jgi:raffinose/stachyose/melibiose transport system substrate-binding protein
MGAHSMLAPPDTAYPVPVADAFYKAAAYVAEGAKSPQEALAWLDAELAKVPP